MKNSTKKGGQTLETMETPPLAAFAATEFATVEMKQKFFDQLMRFIRDGFPRNQFKKPMYERLRMMFGHIAHTDIDGFWDEWFSTDCMKTRWLERLIRHTPMGPVDSTWTDVEREIHSAVLVERHHQTWCAKCDEQVAATEIETMKALMSKYPIEASNVVTSGELD